MASLDKISVRTEVSRLKADFEQLCADGKISAESKALMLSMFMIIELILSIFLERTTKKDNTQKCGCKQKLQHSFITNQQG